MAPCLTRPINNHANFIWGVADLLRGGYRQSEYGKVILPLTVLRRLDCVLASTKKEVLDRYERLKGKVDNIEPVLCAVTGHSFYNTSPLDLRGVLGDQNQLVGNLQGYIAGFSPTARDLLEKFGLDAQITRLARSNLLYSSCRSSPRSSATPPPSPPRSSTNTSCPARPNRPETGLHGF